MLIVLLVFKCYVFCLLIQKQVDTNSNNMSNTIDLTGDGGVVKTIVRRAKADAITPSESLPLVDGMLKLVSST